MTPLLPAAALRFVFATTLVSLATTVPAAQNTKDDSRKPKFVLRAQPSVSIAPARVVLTAEIVGGADDFEDYYCPAVEWEWGDDTTSESSADCDPYEAGKSVIKRRYTIQHMFRRDGSIKVYVHLKKKDKILASASATIQVQPGGPQSY